MMNYTSSPVIRHSRNLILFSLAIILLAVGAYAERNDADSITPNIDSLVTPFEISPLKLKCVDVHQADDKCAFVRQYCDEDTGLLSYLDFYFCSMYSLTPLYWTIMVIWLLTIFASIGVSASDFLTVNLGTLSSKIRMSHSLAGVTLLALGNGSPDLFSTFTAMSNHSGSLAVGELIGAAGFITTVVAAATALPKAFRVKKYGFMRDIVFFALAVSFGMYFLIDGHLALWECIVMVVFYIVYVATVFSWHLILERITKRQARQQHAREHFTPSLVQPVAVAMGDIDAGESDERQAFLGERRSESDDGEDDEEGPETREQLMADMVSMAERMRVTHRHRRTFSRLTSTGQPVRPSLLGALEFGSVLSTLERSRAQKGPSSTVGRRHTHDHLSALQQSRSDENLTTFASNEQSPHRSPPGRSVSPSLLDPEDVRVQRVRSVSANAADIRAYRPTHALAVAAAVHLVPEPTAATTAERASSEQRDTAPRRPGLLAPLQIPEISISDPSGQRSAVSGDDGSTFDFPRYTDDENFNSTTSPIVSSPVERQSWPTNRTIRRRQRLVTFFRAIGQTLFPQLDNWSSKSMSAKLMSLLSIPAIIVLTLTVPIGEIFEERATARNEPPSVGKMAPELLARSTDSYSTSPLLSPTTDPGETLIDAMEDDHSSCWSPYLMSVQILAAPIFFFFVVYKRWLGIEESDLQLIICSCTVVALSLILLGLFWYKNVPNKVPSWQPWLSVPGFIVAIAWISMIADEVVGVLKAFQLITGFSEAILGLIVFAAGNSVSDLFANYNTARVGRPVMAFHACFGGPMLNILLGIGLGGMYHSIKKGQKHSDDGRPPLGTQFHIDVGRTLIVSTAGLLLTLLALSVALWRNKWVMDRRIGYALTCFWCLITVANVALEILQLRGVIKPW